MTVTTEELMLEELIKIRKLLAWMVKEKIKRRDGAEYKLKTFNDVMK